MVSFLREFAVQLSRPFPWGQFCELGAGFPLARNGEGCIFTDLAMTLEVWLGEEWTSKHSSIVSEALPNLLLGWVRGHHLPGVKPSCVNFPQPYSTVLHSIPAVRGTRASSSQELPKVWVTQFCFLPCESRERDIT